MRGLARAIETLAHSRVSLDRLSTVVGAQSLGVLLPEVLGLMGCRPSQMTA
jgi:hypothetical protein